MAIVKWAVNMENQKVKSENAHIRVEQGEQKWEQGMAFLKEGRSTDLGRHGGGRVLGKEGQDSGFDSTSTDLVLVLRSVKTANGSS